MVPVSVRALFGLGFAGVLGLGLALLFKPSVRMATFPWNLTPLTARVIASWLTIPGVAGIMMVGDARWSSWRVTVQTASIWWGLLLRATWRSRGDVDRSGSAITLFVATLSCC